jgi:hypothetical protein
MSQEGETSGWSFFRFALFVTGHGEREFLASLFRDLEKRGHCHFQVVHKVPHLSPIRSTARRQEMVRVGKEITTKDEEIGIKARTCLRDRCDFVLLVDDFERDRAEQAAAVYDRYRAAFDVMLRPSGLEARASVHFLVNMLEAYYFADASAVNSVLGTRLDDFEGDVETIPHPKNALKAVIAALGQGRSFDEVEHGRAIIQRLNLPKALSRPETCRSLRTAFAWCNRAMGFQPTELFRLADGQLFPITAVQLDRLPPVSV